MTHVTIFWNGNLYKYLFSECFQIKMFSKIALLQGTDEFLIFRAIAELKSFGFSCVVIGQQYSLNFILVSYFHFEIFQIMVDIFLFTAICVFSLCILTILVIPERITCFLLLPLWEDRIENPSIIKNRS